MSVKYESFQCLCPFCTSINIRDDGLIECSICNRLVYFFCNSCSKYKNVCLDTCSIPFCAGCFFPLADDDKGRSYQGFKKSGYFYDLRPPSLLPRKTFFSRLTEILALKKRYAVFLIFTLMSMSAFICRPAFAAIIYSQTNSDTYYQGSTVSPGELVLGTNSIWYSITIRAASSYAGQTLSVGVARCGSGSSSTSSPSCGYGSPTDYGTNMGLGATINGTSTAVLTSTPTNYTFTLNNPIYASSTKIWAIYPVRGTYNQDFKIYTSSNDSDFPTGTCYGFSTVVVSPCTGSSRDLYFVVYDSGGSYVPPAVNTTVLDNIAGTFHVTGSWIASSIQCASQYLDVWENTGLETHRELTLHGVLPVVSAPIYATTTGTFDLYFDIINSGVSIGATSTTYSLTPNQQFYAQLYQSSCNYDPFTNIGTPPNLLISTTTSVVSTTSTIVEGGISNNPWTSANFGSSSVPSSTDMLSFVNVPNLLATKVPFAYIFQVSAVIYSAVSTSTSATPIPTGSFSFKFPTHFGASGPTATSTISVDMFSTTTIGYFLTPTYVGLLRGLMVAITYFLTAWYLFHEARSRKLL